MEQRFYKVRLEGGRVIGPIDLDRLTLFILRGKITGGETARLYPEGDWTDINKFPEIADLLLKKLEGKLEAPQVSESEEPESIEVEDAPEASEEAPKEEASKKSLELEFSNAKEQEESEDESDSSQTQTVEQEKSPDDEATVIITADDEATKMYSPEEDEEAGASSNDKVDIELGSKQVALAGDVQNQPNVVDSDVASEPTAMLSIPEEKLAGGGEPPKNENFLNKKKKVFLGIALALCALMLLVPDEKVPEETETKFQVRMPVTKTRDPGKSKKFYAKSMTYYQKDSVGGYRKAAKGLLKAASLDPNNVKALCMLASSYMNLIDVSNRDENYFAVVKRLIEMARAKGVDLPETVIADVELYHILGNPDVAKERISVYSKNHSYGPRMFYYLALTFYLNEEYEEAINFLKKIERKDWFSPKVPFLYGLLFQKDSRYDDAEKAFRAVLKESPNHIKARVHLMEVLFSKDNLPKSQEQADFVVRKRKWASDKELAQALFYRARILSVGAQYEKAVGDLKKAIKLVPDNSDFLLEYYTIRARAGKRSKTARGTAKMFHFMAEGEKALRNNMVDLAMNHFLSARQAQEKSALPLQSIAKTFILKGDMGAAVRSYEKAVALAPKNVRLYGEYLEALINSYEFEKAMEKLKVYQALGPVEYELDQLQGLLFFKQEKLREARAYLKRALSSPNVGSDVYIAYADVMSAGGAHQDAAFYYGLGLRFDPYNTRSVIGVGKALSEMAGPDRGVNYILGVLRRAPASKKAPLLNGIAEIYVKKGDYPNATKYAKRSLDADKDFALAYQTLGDAYAAQDNTREALDYYLTYTNLAPLDPSGPIKRYRIYFKKMDLKAAKTEINKVIEAYPRYPGAFYMLGELYREGRNYKSALKAAMREIKANRSYLPGYVLAGKSYNLMGDHPNALKMLNLALKINPRFVPALIHAAFANQQLKSYAAARSLLERALSVDSGNPQVHKRLGLLYDKMDDRQKACQHFRAYLDLLPDAKDRAQTERYLRAC